ncbi:MAG: sigma-70 family RNA polymerase sigma factor [Phycisphaerales bacterium]|nr:sigma-70 family RNA polymerase sigma factor [Phycisphaerales bacterium]
MDVVQHECRRDRGALSRREALEARIVRLAVVLTGDKEAAVRLIERVLGDRPRRRDVARMDLAHVDRLAVLRAREVRASKDHRAKHDVFAGEAGRVLSALHTLPGQPMEAWVLAHVERLDLREVSRAMDCSTTAIGRHLEHAEAKLRDLFGDEADEAAGALYRAMEMYRPGEVIATVRGVRRRRTWGRLVVALVLVVVAVTVVLILKRLATS